MHLRYLTNVISIVSLLFLVSACRNAPELPPVPKDTEVNVRIANDPTGLNFLLNAENNAILVMRQLFLPLLDFNPVTYELEAVLAKSLPKIEEVSKGDKKGLLAYDFEILEEAVWDDGTPITGKDFLFTLKAIYNPNYRSPYVGSFDFLEEVVINPDNPKKFTVYARKYFIGEATIGNFVPMPAHLLDPTNVYNNYTLVDLRDPKNKEKLASDPQLKTVGTLFSNPKQMGQEGELSGSGGYKLTNWEQGQALTLVKKESWWGDQINRKALAANPKKITFKIIPDFNAARSLFMNGELDLMKGIGVNDFEELKKTPYFQENFNFYTPDIFMHRVILINTTKVKLEDKKVRRALAHLLNLNDVFDVVYGGEKNPVASVIHPSKPTYNKNLKPIEYNVATAKKLLQEAGWKDSNNNGILDKMIDGELEELTLKMSYPANSTTSESVFQLFKEGATKAGINLELAPTDGRSMLASYRQKEYDLGVMGLNFPYTIPKDLAQRWPSDSPRNYAGFGTVESDQIIEEIKQTTDEDKLIELYMRFQEIFYEEQPLIFINTARDHIIASKKFGEITTSAVSPTFFVNELQQVSVPVTSSKN